MGAARVLFRRALTGWEIAGLAGAPEDAAIDVGICGGCLYLEMYQPTTFDYQAIYRLSAADGRPVAVIAPFKGEEGQEERPNRSDLPSFEQALLSLPHDLDF